ncbi:rapid alkalinization factor 23-like [Rhodamnia argentea]|uniref:Rapid alkalinization factor 23-like n=1 Tax=Rhodamnia argentea TaxID=178133 RepID=A0A8B8MQG5_9MYRT|nr:rapid alkalinization factor 23-like [Rhodamnia argentea]
MTGSGQLFRDLLILAVCLALFAHVSAFSPLDFAAVMPYSAGECRGSIAECLAGGAGDGEWGEELAMDSETNRRILAATRYIGYGALGRDTVPCSKRGVSYSNCRAGAAANPYTRACVKIAHCRG